MNKLISFVKEFTKEEIAELSKIKKIGRSYYLLSEELEKTMATCGVEPFSAGMFYGEMSGSRFKPSFTLLTLLSKHTARKALVGEKGQTLFLYRNNLFPESIKRLGAESGFVLVENERGEILGYGEVKEVREQKIVKHILDRSDFLRREPQHRK